MISKQETFTLSPYMALYDLNVPKENMLRQIKRFKDLAKRRHIIEAKNSELKNQHGYNMGKSAGLFGLEVQGATIIFAVDLKRILKLLNKD